MSHAFSWTARGGMVDLGTLGGTSSDAVAVNDSGQVVGSSTTSDALSHAFSWTARGGMVDLGTLPSGTYSNAAGVNDSGHVVGSSNTTGGASHAVLWTAGIGGGEKFGTEDRGKDAARVRVALRARAGQR